MISKAQFEKAQKIMKCDYTTRPKKYEFAYSGLIKCGECGAAVTAEKKTNRYGSKYIYYHCTKRKKDISCSQSCIEEKELEKQFVAFLDTISIEEDTLKLVLDILDREKDTVKDEQRAISKSMQKQLTECEKSLSELLNIKLRGLLSDQEFAAKRNELDARKRRLEDRLKSTSSNFDDPTKKTAELFEYASKVIHIFKNGSISDKKSILRYVGSNPTLYSKKLSINAVKPFRFIQTPYKSRNREKGRFEPRKIALHNTQTVTESDGFCAKLALVKHVRTFFLESDSCPQNDGT